MTKLKEYKMFINGTWIDAENKKTFESLNPENNEPWAVVPEASANDVNKAVDAAKSAFKDWKDTNKEFRVDLLEKLLQIYKKRFDEMAKAISDEMGAPIDWASEVQTASGQTHLEDFIFRLKEYKFEKNFNE